MPFSMTAVLGKPKGCVHQGVCEMDRYNVIVKIEQIKECLNDNKNDEALDIAADLDIGKVKESYHLMILAKVFAANGMLVKAKSCYDRVYAKNKTRHVAMELANLSIRLKNIVEAERYLDEFKELAPDHYMRHVFKYKIDRLKGKALPDLIDSLEKLKKEEFFENWGFELAKLYNKNGDAAKCVATCNDVIIWFSEGEYVDRAKLLKAHITGDRSELGKNEAELIAVYGPDGTLSAKKLAKMQAEKESAAGDSSGISADKAENNNNSAAVDGENGAPAADGAERTKSEPHSSKGKNSKKKNKASKKGNSYNNEELGQTRVMDAKESAAIREKAALAEGQTVVFNKVTDKMAEDALNSNNAAGEQKQAGQNNGMQGAENRQNPGVQNNGGQGTENRQNTDVKNNGGQGTESRQSHGVQNNGGQGTESRQNTDVKNNGMQGVGEQREDIRNTGVQSEKNLQGISDAGEAERTVSYNEKTVKGKKNKRKKEKIKKKYGSAAEITHQSEENEKTDSSEAVAEAVINAADVKKNAGGDEVFDGTVIASEVGSRVAEMMEESFAEDAEKKSGYDLATEGGNNGGVISVAAEEKSVYEKAAAESQDDDEALIYKLLAEEDRRIAEEKAAEEARRAEKARRKDTETADNIVKKAESGSGKAEGDNGKKAESDNVKETESTAKENVKKRGFITDKFGKAAGKKAENAGKKAVADENNIGERANDSDRSASADIIKESRENPGSGDGNAAVEPAGNTKTAPKDEKEKRTGEIEKMATVREEEDIYEPGKPKYAGIFSGGVLDRFLSENNTSLEEYFAYFAFNDNICVQLVQSLDVMLSDKKYMSYCLQCEKGSGKKAVINGMTRLLYDAGQLTSAKPVWADADGVNNIELETKAAKLKGRCLAVDKVGKLNERSVQSVVNLMKTGEIAVVLIDYGRNIKKLTKDNEELEELILNKIEMPSFGPKELEEFVDYKVAASGLVYSKEAYEKIKKKIRAIAKNSEEGVLAATEKYIAKIIDNTETRNAEALVKQALAGGELVRTDVITVEDIPEE